MICPSCHRDNPEHANPSDLGAKPEPGDISLCFACAAIGIFTEDGVRKPTDEELAELLTHDNIIQAQKACLESAYVDEAIDGWATLTSVASLASGAFSVGSPLW